MFLNVNSRYKTPTTTEKQYNMSFLVESNNHLSNGASKNKDASLASRGEETEAAYVPIMDMAKTLPTATGSVPQVLENIELDEQHAQAEELFCFLDKNPKLARLNGGKKTY